MKNVTFGIHRLAIVALLLLLPTSNDAAAVGEHDLFMEPAFNITAPTNSTNWHSPDIKLGADFGDSSVPDIVRRGAVTPIFAKFAINGTQDQSLPLTLTGSGLMTNQVKIVFHYRPAMIGETPPAGDHASWELIGGDLPVEFAAPPAELFAITKIWPTDFPSVITKSVDWTPPTDGDLFHVRAEVVYPDSGPDDANPDDNVAVSLYGSILGLRDVDLVIVHDASGSMRTHSYLAQSYIDHAKDRAQAFVVSMNPNHKLAVVAFGGCLSGGVDDVWGTPVPPLQFATPVNTAAAWAAIGGVTASCGTPMGVGIERAISILTSEPVDPARKRAILLLSDGYDNAGTPRACTSVPDPAEPCLSEPVLANLQAHDIRVFTIALGTAAWSECLECLADGSGGRWYSTPTPGLSLAHVYADMQQVYSADDLYRVDIGTSGGGGAYQIYFEGVDDFLYFILQSDQLDAGLGLEIQPPGHAWLKATAIPGAVVHEGRGHTVVVVAGPDEGHWGYRVIGPKGQDYLTAVRSNRVARRLELEVESAGVVGTPIRITAKLSDRDQPISGAQLTATVEVPVGRSFETRLRQLSRAYIARHGVLPLDPAIQKQNPDWSPRAVLLETLEKGGQALVETEPIEVALEETGPGIYTGSLAWQTRVAGEYTVTVQYRSDRADRVQSQSLRLRPGPMDFRRSFAEIVKTGRAGAQTWYLRFYPMDAAGNAIVATGLTKDLAVSLRRAQRTEGLKAVFDSAYQEQLVASGKHRPRLRALKIDRRKISRKPGHHDRLPSIKIPQGEKK